MSHSFTASRQDTPRGSYCPGHKPDSSGTGHDPTGSTCGPRPPPRAPRVVPAPHLAALAAEPVAAHGVVGQGALLAAVSPAPGTLLPGQQQESRPGISPPAAPGAGEQPPDPAHRQRAAVALLARLHKAIAALRGVQELRGQRRGHDTDTQRAAGDPRASCCREPPERASHPRGMAAPPNCSFSCFGSSAPASWPWRGLGTPRGTPEATPRASHPRGTPETTPRESLPTVTPRGAVTFRGLLKRQLPPPSCRNWLYSSMLQRENFRGRWYLRGGGHCHTVTPCPCPGALPGTRARAGPRRCPRRQRGQGVWQGMWQCHPERAPTLCPP